MLGDTDEVTTVLLEEMLVDTVEDVLVDIKDEELTVPSVKVSMWLYYIAS